MKRFIAYAALTVTMLTATAASAQQAAPPPAGHGAMGGFRPPKDRSAPSPTLPAGTVRVEVVDANQSPITDAKVKLIKSFQSIQQGNSSETLEKPADAQGRAQFDGLEAALRYSYSVEVERDGAKFFVPAFRLGKTGHRVVVHTYPATHDVFEAFVAASGGTQISLREDAFHVSIFYRVINLSQKAWLPEGVFLDLPKEAKAIETSKMGGDAGFEGEGPRLKIVGTFPPGSRDLQVSFQLPNQNTESVSFSQTVPFHLLEYIVAADKAPGMTMRIPGFDEPTTRPTKEGKSTLFVHRNLRREKAKLESISIELSGLPVIGPGRWIAAALAFAIFAGGLFSAIFRRKSKADATDEQKARGILLDEMKLLEHAFKQGEVGPRTYEQTKREIINAIARLEPLSAGGS